MVAKVIYSRGWWWFSLVFAVYVLSQVLPVTRLVYHPKQVSIYGDTVVMERSFTSDLLGLPRPRLSYVEQVRPLTPTHHGGQSCRDEGGPFRYTRAPEVRVPEWIIATTPKDGVAEWSNGATPEDGVAEWNIAAWAAPCLSDPFGYRWSAEWTWQVGAFRFGPVSKALYVYRPQPPARRSGQG